LTRDRQISELAEKVGRLEQEFEQLRSRRSDLAETLATVEEERRDLSQRRQRQEIRCTELQKDLEMAKREANTVAESMRRLDWRIGEIDKQAEQHLDARATAGERLDEVRAEISSLEEQLRDAEGHSETSGAETQRLNEEVQALAIEVARAREQLESLRLRHERAAAEVDEMQQRIKAAEAERERLLGENEEAEEQVQTLDARLTALMEERRELESRTTERRGVSDSAGVELRRLNQEIHVATRERNELQNRVHDLDLRKSQHEMHLEHCDAEAQEKFQTPMAEILKAHTEIPEDLTPLRDQAAQLRERLAGIGPVNVIAIEEYEELKTRLEFLSTQETDLLSAKRNLEHTIEELDRTSNRIFTESFEQIRNNFQQSFRRLFGGGRADLVALEPENLLESGIDIIAQPPGKKLQTISLLSGGEKALTAIALLFAIFLQKPSPFCVLDEIDAPLDDKNIGRFKDMLTEFAQTTQFIIITHNKLTMQLADTLFGITMEEPGVSRLVGVDIQAAAAYAA
jgi:chromosome segregation protein